MARRKALTDVAAKLPPPAPAADSEQVTQRQDGDTLEARSTSRRIRTVDDLLRHIDADLDRYEVAASEATKWECGDGDGGTVELHRVFVRLKPRGGPSTRDVVAAMIDGAKKSFSPTKKIVSKLSKRRAPIESDLLQLLVVADTHFGKYAWGRTTGGDDYDLGIAERLVGEAGRELLAAGEQHRPAKRVIAFLGDLFHYDTPHGTTTSGTPLERDGRLQKMIAVGCDTLLSLVEKSAETVPTDVYCVNGNHDEVLTWAFQRILLERFRGARGVTISDEFTGRQYFSHGKNLLGFAHGHRAKKKLPQLMALEAASEWSRCPYREWHTGHYHAQAAIETLDGVVTRTAPAICPPDDWHAANGFVGSRQAMETFLYSHDGGLVAMHVASPKGK
jgi:metallophosphoesterase superfamily enzyme